MTIQHDVTTFTVDNGVFTFSNCPTPVHPTMPVSFRNVPLFDYTTDDINTIGNNPVVNQDYMILYYEFGDERLKVEETLSTKFMQVVDVSHDCVTYLPPDDGSENGFYYHLGTLYYYHTFDDTADVGIVQCEDPAATFAMIKQVLC